MRAKLVERSFSIVLNILHILGFYSSDKHKLLYTIYTCFMYCTCIIPVPTLATLYLIFGENVDFAQVCDSAFLISETGSFIIKFIPFVINGDEIKESIFMLESEIFNNYMEKQEHIIKESIRICRRNSLINLSFCSTGLTTWAVTPLFSNKGIRELPVKMWLPFDPIADTKTYFFTYLAAVLGIGVADGAITNGAIDPLISGLACQATAQLKILKDNLEKLGQYADEEVLKITQSFTLPSGINLDHLKSQIIYKKIKHCILHYGAILKFVNKFENTFTTVVFTQFMASALVLCNACLQLSRVPFQSFDFCAMVAFLCAMLMKNFLYSYYGTTLYEESNTLTDAIYMGKWYEYDSKCQKALIILMERSKKPMTILAGKIVPISLVTFTTILRRAYSLLAVLKNY